MEEEEGAEETAMTRLLSATLRYRLHAQKSAIFIDTLMNVFKLCFQSMSYMEFVLKHVVLKAIHHIITVNQSISCVH